MWIQGISPSSCDSTKSQERELLPSEFVMSFKSTNGLSFTVFEELSWYPVVYLVNLSYVIVVQDDRMLSLFFLNSLSLSRMKCFIIMSLEFGLLSAFLVLSETGGTWPGTNETASVKHTGSKSQGQVVWSFIKK